MWIDTVPPAAATGELKDLYQRIALEPGFEATCRPDVAEP